MVALIITQVNNNLNLIPLIITAITSIAIAVLTSYLSRKSDVNKIRLENKNLTEKINYEVKQLIISVESANYRNLYEKKLLALKEIKKISFNLIEINPHAYSEMDDFLDNFPYKELKEELHVFIIEHSYIFLQSDIIKLMKSIYHDCEYFLNEADEEWGNSLAKDIYNNLLKLIPIIERNLEIDLSTIQSKLA